MDNYFNLYNTKPHHYFSFSRPEMISFIPKNVKNVLDVGCGVGAFGEILKKTISCRVSGVELIPSMAGEAKNRIDKVYAGPFDNSLNLPSSSFDCIVFNDVLEHMIYPCAALDFSKSLLTPNGYILASVPNFRHFPVVWKLAFKGQLDYSDSGILDRTHLRFFTRSSLLNLFLQSGYQIINIEGINRYMVNSSDEHRLWRYLKILQILFPKKFHDMGFLQFAILATLPHDSHIPPVKPVA